MPINKRKNVSRMRGTHSHGWGDKKKHRGGGNRGGRGNAGMGKRADAMKPSMWKNTLYFGKHGFKMKNAVDVNAVNLQYIENHIENLVKQDLAALKSGVYTIDLTKLGFDKLLSKGNVSKKIHLTVDAATESAIAKVEQAGGSVKIAEKEEPSKASSGSSKKESKDSE